MKTLSMNFWGQSKYWWIVLVAGILLVLGGFAYWFWPAAGYAVASQIFGWLLVLAGLVQICVSAGADHHFGLGRDAAAPGGDGRAPAFAGLWPAVPACAPQGGQL